MRSPSTGADTKGGRKDSCGQGGHSGTRETERDICFCPGNGGKISSDSGETSPRQQKTFQSQTKPFSCNPSVT
ncbi:MAG: hypothetical protein ACTTK1_05450 [Candidatus Cryptobacteroides sp.]